MVEREAAVIVGDGGDCGGDCIESFMVCLVLFPVQNMWESVRKIKISKSPSEVYKILGKVSEWQRWDVDLKHVKLDNPELESSGSLEGATGVLDMVFGLSFNFKLQNVVKDKTVEYTTPLFGAADTVWFWRLGDGSASGSEETDLEMGVRQTGWLSEVYRFAIQSKSETSIQICLNNLKELAETGKIASEP